MMGILMQVDVMEYEEKGFNDVMGILMQVDVMV